MKKLALSLAVIVASGVYVWNHPRLPDALGSIPSGDDLLQTTALPILPPATTSPPAAVIAPAVDAAAGPATPSPSAPGKVPRYRSPPIAEPARTSAQPAPGTLATLINSGPALPPARTADLEAPAATVAATVAAPAPSPEAPVPPARPAGLAVNTRPVVMPAAMTSATSQYADGVYTGSVTNAYYGLMQIQAVIEGGRLSSIRVLQYPSDRRISVFINRQALPMLRDEVIQAQNANVDIITGATLSSRAFIRSLDDALRQARA